MSYDNLEPLRDNSFTLFKESEKAKDDNELKPLKTTFFSEATLEDIPGLDVNVNLDEDDGNGDELGTPELDIDDDEVNSIDTAPPEVDLPEGDDLMPIDDDHIEDIDTTPPEDDLPEMEGHENDVHDAFEVNNIDEEMDGITNQSVDEVAGDTNAMPDMSDMSDTNLHDVSDEDLNNPDLENMDLGGDTNAMNPDGTPVDPMDPNVGITDPNQIAADLQNPNDPNYIPPDDGTISVDDGDDTQLDPEQEERRKNTFKGCIEKLLNTFKDTINSFDDMQLPKDKADVYEPLFDEYRRVYNKLKKYIITDMVKDDSFAIMNAIVDYKNLFVSLDEQIKELTNIIMKSK